MACVTTGYHRHRFRASATLGLETHRGWRAFGAAFLVDRAARGAAFKVVLFTTLRFGPPPGGSMSKLLTVIVPLSRAPAPTWRALVDNRSAWEGA